jgi:hypothetical protein
MPRALEPPHPPFPLSRGLVRVLRPVIESPVPPVLDAGQHVPHCRPVARKLVGDHDTRHIRQAFEQPTQEFRGGGLVTTRLHENVEDVPVSWPVSPSAMILFWQSIPMSAKKLPRME